MSISNISIGKRLALVVLVPLIAIIYFTTKQISSTYLTYTEMNEVAGVGERVSELGEVIHFFQLERGQTVGFLASKGTQGAEQLATVRTNADQHKNELITLLAKYSSRSDMLGTTATNLVRDLKAIDNVRRDVDNLSTDGDKSFDVYTDLINNLIDFSVELSLQGISSTIAADVIAYNQLMQAKELAAQERGVGNGFLQASELEQKRLAQFASYAGAQQSLLNGFLQLKDEQQKLALEQRLSFAADGVLARVRRQVINGGVFADLTNFDAKDWFAETTKRIDAMRAIEVETVNYLIGVAKKNAEDALFGLKVMIGVLALGLAAIIAISVKIAFTISRPINRLVSVMQSITAGNLAQVEMGADRADEIGEMARAVEGFRQAALRNRELEAEAEQNRLNAQEQQRLAQERADAEAQRRMDEATSALAHALRSLAAGDMHCEINEPLAPQFEALRQDFNGSVRQLREALQTVSASVAIVHGGAFEISQASDDLSRRTEQQASSLEETAAALEQITVNVNATSVRSNEAREVTQLAHQQAGVSGQIVQNAVTAMERIDAASRQISQIIGVIDEIAFQTNLLALNAGVEAARAGEAGKGFAVVAQEVRDLAQRSANAAREIKQLITNSETAVAEGVQLVSDTGKGLTDIASLVDRVYEYMNAIATAAQEQAAGLSEINAAINHMDQSTQKNAAMVEEMNAAGANLASESETLDRLLASFKLEDDDIRRAA